MSRQARMRVAETGLTMAEYFRDEQHKNVLLFIDNIFRFTQAGSEVSALLGRMPSAVGISRHWLRRWVNYRRGSLLQRMDLSLPYRLYMYQPMT